MNLFKVNDLNFVELYCQTMFTLCDLKLYVLNTCTCFLVCLLLDIHGM